MKNMPGKKSVVSLVLGSAFAIALGFAPVASASHDGGKEGRWMSMVDNNQDGRVSADEYARHCQMMFDKIDTNKDGYIDKAEAAQAKKGHAGSGYNKYGTPTGGSDMQHMKPMGQ